MKTETKMKARSPSKTPTDCACYIPTVACLSVFLLPVFCLAVVVVGAVVFFFFFFFFFFFSTEYQMDRTTMMITIIIMMIPNSRKAF